MLQYSDMGFFIAMNINDLKLQIKTDLLNHKGRLSPWANRNNKNEVLIKQIIGKTSFLSHDSTLASRAYCILNNITITPVCKTCQKPTKFHNSYYNFATYCSAKCGGQDPIAKKRSKQAMTKMVNVPGWREKADQTKLEKYGSVNNHEKIKQTCLAKYGVDNVSKTKHVKDKISKKKTGVSNKYPIGNHYSQKHLTKEQIELLKDLSILEKEHVEQKIPITTLSLKYGFSDSTLHHIFNRNKIKNHIFADSKPQRDVEDFLNNNNITYNKNNRTLIKPQELDFYLPLHNLAIELNGLFWHNDIRKPSNYHLDKHNACETNNIRLMQFWDTEWINKSEICKSIILSALGIFKETIFARKTEVKEITYKDCAAFCTNNHLQGPAITSINLGLFYNEELVSIMSFAKPRFDKKHNFELVRFANKLNTKIVGGASKLFSHFQTLKPNSSVVSYCDKRIFSGKLYSNLGFNLASESKPNYFYFTKQEYKLHSRNKFQKHKLSSKLDIFDSNLSEFQNMTINGYLKIWDCGNMVFSYIP